MMRITERVLDRTGQSELAVLESQKMPGLIVRYSAIVIMRN